MATTTIQPRRGTRKITPRRRKAAPKPNGERAYARALLNKPDEMFRCRGLRHAWSESNTARVIEPTTDEGRPVLRLDFPCLRGCGAVKHFRLIVRRRRDNSFEVVGRLKPTLSYPDEYLIHGIPREDRNADVWWNVFVAKAGYAQTGQR